ncbi:hypothetical protein FYJ24_05260 [Actinomycetaceae bacterium WB03_NA08]|uniref:Uncharacterized protein n=1 Tax=Scrofimicrobium canadense TaxID=2652290 RepID=A0A6N7VR16_9ACTO|nr:hypothetical protein [Scrofimicrobium canadense]MSS84184.1 hypothetical protein [Scrofimicrobium canadense]
MYVLFEGFVWGVLAEAFSGLVVDFVDDLVGFLFVDRVEPGLFGQVTADVTVEVLVCSALLG